jgi:hypothetical protein
VLRSGYAFPGAAADRGGAGGPRSARNSPASPRCIGREAVRVGGGADKGAPRAKLPAPPPGDFWALLRERWRLLKGEMGAARGAGGEGAGSGGGKWAKSTFIGSFIGEFCGASEIFLTPRKTTV